MESLGDKTLSLLISRSEDSIELLRLMLEDSIRQRNGGRLTKGVPRVEPSPLKRQDSPEPPAPPVEEELIESDLVMLQEELGCVQCREMTVGAHNRLVECTVCRALYHQGCHSPSIPDSLLMDPKALFNCSTCLRVEEATQSTNETGKEIVDEIPIPVFDLTLKDESDKDDEDLFIMEVQAILKTPPKSPKKRSNSSKETSSTKKKTQKISSPENNSNRSKPVLKLETSNNKKPSEKSGKSISVTKVKGPIPLKKLSKSRPPEVNPSKTSKSTEKGKPTNLLDTKAAGDPQKKKTPDTSEPKSLKEKHSKEELNKKDTPKVTSAAEVKFPSTASSSECKPSSSKVTPKKSVQSKQPEMGLKKSSSFAMNIASRRSDSRPVRPLDLMERPPKVFKGSPKKDLKKFIAEKLRQKLLKK